MYDPASKLSVLLEHQLRMHHDIKVIYTGCNICYVHYAVHYSTLCKMKTLIFCSDNLYT